MIEGWALFVIGNFYSDLGDHPLATALFVADWYPLQTAFCEGLKQVSIAEFFSQSFEDPAVAADRINQ